MKLRGNVGGSNSSFDHLPDSGVLICPQMRCFNLTEFLDCNGKPVQQKVSSQIFVFHSISIVVALNHLYIIWFFFRLPNLVISKFLKHFLKLRPFSSGCNANLWGTTLIIFMQSYNCFLNIVTFFSSFFFFLFNLIS